MAFRGLMVTAGVASGMAAGSVFLASSRWQSVESRRAQLNNEYTAILEEMRSFDELCLKEADDLRQKKKNTALLLETVNTLWSDRFDRYVQTNKELHSYLKALPEALGALKGLTSHYHYMITEMRKFVAFDVACSKVHNLALLLEHGDCVGVMRVSETIRQLFAAEPLVHVVCSSLRGPIAERGAPSSVCDASSSFVFCMEELDRAVAAVAADFTREPNDPSRNTPNALCDGSRRLLRGARLPTRSGGEVAMGRERQSLQRLLRRNRRQLHTVEDVTSALQYAADVAQQLHPSASKDDALRAAIGADAKVQAAREQLLTWRDSAAVFLVRQQAQEALHAYHLLLAETLTKVKKS